MSDEEEGIKYTEYFPLEEGVDWNPRFESKHIAHVPQLPDAPTPWEMRIPDLEEEPSQNAMDFYVDLARHYEKTDPINFLQFLIKHFKHSPEATNSDGDFDPYAWQRGVALMYGNLDIFEVNTIKPAQCGMTQLYKALCGFEVALRRRSCCVVQPTEGFAKWFSTLQIRTLLRDCEVVADALGYDPEKSNDPANKADQKVFKNTGATLFIKGAHTAGHLKGFSCATMLVDEVDVPKLDIDGEGTVDALASLRTKEAPAPKQINQSSPTVMGSSRIQQLIDDVPEHAVFTYWIRCPECGHNQKLQFGGKSDNFGLKWDEVYLDRLNSAGEQVLDLWETSKTTRYVCASRACTFEHSQLPDIDETGRWQSSIMYLDVANDVFRDINSNEIVQTPPRVGIKITGLLSYVVSWNRAVYDFLDGLQSAKAGNSGKLKKFQNGYLGEVTQPFRNEDLANWEDLQLRVRDYPECPHWVQFITVGMDIGKDHIVYEAVGWGEHYEAISLYRRRVTCRPVTDESIERATQKARKLVFKMECGVEKRVGLVMVDSRFATDKVMAACAKNPVTIIPIQGSGTIGAVPVRMQKTPDAEYRVFKCTVGVQTIADTVAELLTVELQPETDRTPGYQHFPDTPWHDKEYFQELCGEHLKLSYEKNEPVYRWTKLTKDTRVESLDCRRYAYAGVKLAELRYDFSFIPDAIWCEKHHPESQEASKPKAKNGMDKAASVFT